MHSAQCTNRQASVFKQSSDGRDEKEGARDVLKRFALLLSSNGYKISLTLNARIPLLRLRRTCHQTENGDMNDGGFVPSLFDCDIVAEAESQSYNLAKARMMAACLAICSK
jgi:hypothetical protein